LVGKGAAAVNRNSSTRANSQLHHSTWALAAGSQQKLSLPCKPALQACPTHPGCRARGAACPRWPRTPAGRRGQTSPPRPRSSGRAALQRVVVVAVATMRGRHMNIDGPWEDKGGCCPSAGQEARSAAGNALRLLRRQLARHIEARQTRTRGALAGRHDVGEHHKGGRLVRPIGHRVGVCLQGRVESATCRHFMTHLRPVCNCFRSTVAGYIAQHVCGRLN